MGKCLAIVGATGAVGVEILSILEQRAFPVDELRVFSSQRSAGKTVSFRGASVTVQPLSEHSFEGVDIALFSAGAGVSREWAGVAQGAGCCVIDNSSAFRMDEDVPLIVPEVNGESLPRDASLIANPNCTTILLLMVLGPLHAHYGLRRAVVATYQAASGAGRRAMEELEQQTAAVLRDEPIAAEQFPAPLAFNLIPHCDVFLPDGSTKEEMKVIQESRKILAEPELRLAITAVRVPILRAHSEAVNVELERSFELDALRELFNAAPGVRLLDRPVYGGYPMPILASGSDDVIVGRLRRDPSVEGGLSLFLSGDQLRKGAALNAVQIAELLGGTQG